MISSAIASSPFHMATQSATSMFAPSRSETARVLSMFPVFFSDAIVVLGEGQLVLPIDVRAPPERSSPTIDIAATPEEVWDVLSDFPAYGDWSNFSRVDGVPEVGNRPKMRMPGFWFTSTVTAVTESQELQWSATIIRAALFLGEHNFTLVRKTDGSTQVTNTETFSGVLTRPFEGLFAKSHNAGGYVAFNQSLKSRVESRASIHR
ncbi:hypothetical protein B7495_10600 [Cryobacterium sp. LW097]|nr:hypothetical protein B7495_10600 [Cryobacterium sp. LW097]TFC51122.1 SRPBCC domain-containing protein [Cryobacterium sp. TMB3-1-2]TFC74468.1 SRPBCC domain-containing protein [Cryobacterium sp. TMB3-15]TFC79981.1 SRPBCC domain-containing protein [Cryobacterium sp. TMB3-10]TFC89979.1 SRPBCC domain-containing protein [Cryobacterium sp. TMT4-31]TFD41882.1 SRPBCC domain-containing protein [Cryobacterium sp. TMB3-12]